MSDESILVEDKQRETIRIPAEIGAQYSLFSTEDGETFTGGGSYMIDEFAKHIGKCMEAALKDLLRDNSNKILSLVIVSEKLDYDEVTV